MDISEKVKSLYDSVCTHRRALHALPELSDAEVKTGEYITAALTKLGYKTKRIHTGVFTDVLGRDPNLKRIAFRCDMDALPVQEENDLPFRADRNMHACGHDGHMAMMLGVAEYFAENPPDYPVRLIFQFGEEGTGGAERMIEAGVLDGISEIYAFHLAPFIEEGSLAFSPGAMFAGAVEFDIEFYGLASHCADASEGKDALKCLFDFAADIDTVRTGFEGNTLLHIGAANGGSARNIVADYAKSECTLRYFDSAHMEAIMMNIERLLERVCGARKVSHRITAHAVYPPLINSAYGVSRMNGAVNKAKLNKIEVPAKYTAEDFAFYAEKIPACMAWLGSKSEKWNSPLHSSRFGFDEKVLLYGIQTYINLATKQNGEN